MTGVGGVIDRRFMPARPRRHRLSAGGSAAGFTLLELLVVLAVLGFLMVGLAQGLHLGLQLWARQQRGLDAVGELDATDRALRTLIEQMDPGGRLEMSDIDGTAQTLRFTTRLPAAAGALPTRRAEVMLLVDRLHRLMLRWTPSPHVVPLVSAAQEMRPVETVLLEGVDHIQISYKPPAPGAAWQTAWQNPVPPLLVRIHIAFAPADPRNWPDLVAAPMRARGG
jgi:prepilin-type N-terminal cleavage/methylation domain-containing protein